MTRRILPLAPLGFWLAIASATALALSPIGYRFGWWNVRVALLYLVTGGVALAIVALIISAIALLKAKARTDKRAVILALVSIGLSLGFAGLPIAQVIKSRAAPHIHDISTDTESPPTFIALAEIRTRAPNGLAYHAEVALQQKQAYPEILPFQSRLPADQLFNNAVAVAQDMKWEIVAIARNEGRMEATDTTLLYGFKDDVVIRVKIADHGSQLDVRSMSRVGLSDMGVNAARIRTFLARLQASGA
ncbi:MAG TPA: DUF1499 domain-containing protein [Burkholderiales bacterium]|nr:DUF1499 domain-containing protein [Burkholderiales bacterium]